MRDGWWRMWSGVGPLQGGERVADNKEWFGLCSQKKQEETMIVL